MPAKRSSNSPPLIDRAIEAYTRAYSFIRSFTHPSEVVRVGPLWLIRDTPRKRPADYRVEEWSAHEVEAAEVDRIARQNTRGRFSICAIRTLAEPTEPLRAAYKAAGYRLLRTESIMVHDLAKIPRVAEPFPVVRVTTQDLAERLLKAARRGKLRPEHLLPDAPLRQYVALDHGAPVGWATSIVVGNDTWVSSMHVLPRYRRRGIGKSILVKMLRDDRAHGAVESHLLASHAGAMLYPNVGYELIGELRLYKPRKKPA